MKCCRRFVEARWRKLTLTLESKEISGNGGYRRMLGLRVNEIVTAC